MRDLGLPDSPLKEGEKRAAKWLELYGSEQTEIDALATLQPAELERIAREAVAPYFDAGLAGRVRTAEADWQEQIDTDIAQQVDEDRLDDLKTSVAVALDQLRAVNAELADMADGVEISRPPDLPEADIEALRAAQAGNADAVLIDSRMTFVEATERLREHSEKAARRGHSANHPSPP